MTTQPQDPAQPDPAAPATESPAQGRLRTRPPGFSHQVSQAPSPSLDATTGSSSEGAADSPEPSDEPPASKPRKSGGSRTSSPVEGHENVEKAIRLVVTEGTEAAHQFLVRDPDAVEAELLKADQEDADGIAEPGARLLVRRLTSGIDNPDLVDGLELLVAVGWYVHKQLGKLRELRKSRRDKAASLEDLAEQAGEPAAAS